MNIDSEQITLSKNFEIAQDQPLCVSEMLSKVSDILGRNNCNVINFSQNKKVLRFCKDGKEVHLLLRSCTYLGNPHPIFKKRVQLPLWFNEYIRQNSNVDIRFIGVYRYTPQKDKLCGENLIFIDFNTESYLGKKGHNSSAHVYTNDLYQAMTYGVFEKDDYFGNHITVARKDKFQQYLLGKANDTSSLFELFRQFNCGFTFGQWLKAIDAIKEMHENEWHQWKQAEWAGWFLEYRFNRFTIENNVTKQMRYVGSSLKKDGDLDFDIHFGEANFYGDLKASDVSKKEAPGNDQTNFIDCIYQYDKFWYVIYEHETKKDSKELNYQATRERNAYIKSVDSSYDKDELSYHERMKSKVKFVKMSIVELNRINFRSVLKDFHQGHQPDGSARALKFNIDKSILKNDNFVVFRYTYKQA